MVKVQRLRDEPDDSIEERLILAVLREDRQEVTLKDLCSSQLLPHVSRLVLMPEVADQILHTLFRDRIKHSPVTPEEADQVHVLLVPAA